MYMLGSGKYLTANGIRKPRRISALILSFFISLYIKLAVVIFTQIDTSSKPTVCSYMQVRCKENASSGSFSSCKICYI